MPSRPPAPQAPPPIDYQHHRRRRRRRPAKAAALAASYYCLPHPLLPLHHQHTQQPSTPPSPPISCGAPQTSAAAAASAVSAEAADAAVGVAPLPHDAMCDFTRNYYIYAGCLDPGAHFFRTSVDGSRKHSCPKGPHERYIMLPGHCPHCSG